MHITRETVEAEYEWIRGRNDVIVPLINSVRADLGEAFETTVGDVTRSEYCREVDAVFADGNTAVNVTGLVVILRDLDVAGDYPGFIVDELVGRDLASVIAGGQPFHLLAEATFHYADIHIHYAESAAGADDLDAALAAGFQTRLPGWSWTDQPDPFSV